jgi:MFS family permease
MDVVTAVKNGKMSPAQYLVVFVCFFCNMLDGFDLFVMGFALPHLPAGMASASQKGWLISLGLMGMAVGAFFLAPLADRIGRRRVVAAGLVVGIGATAATALSPTVALMMVFRFATGIGVGLVSTLVIVMAQEYSSLSRRNLCVGFVTVGYPLGSVAGGAIGLLLVGSFGGGWRVLFWAGAVVSLIGLILVVCFLPESLAFLIIRNDDQSRERILSLARRMRLGEVDPSTSAAMGGALPDLDDASPSLLAPRYRRRSLLVWLGYGAVTAAFFFVSTWTPQLISMESGNTRTGTLAGTVVSIGGVLGALVFGIVGFRMLATKFAWIALLVAAVAQVVFALIIDSDGAMVTALVLGMGTFASVSAFTAATPPLYPIQIRARALGAMYGTSRVTSILAPLAAGYALTYMRPRTMYLTASLFLVVGAITAVALWRNTRTHFEAERQQVEDRRRAAPKPNR